MVRLLALVLLAAVVLGAASPAARADLQDGINAYLDGDYATALGNLKPEAEADDVIAQYFLGEMYLHGKGVDQDFAQAATWYERATPRPSISRLPMAAWASGWPLIAARSYQDAAWAKS